MSVTRPFYFTSQTGQVECPSGYTAIRTKEECAKAFNALSAGGKMKFSVLDLDEPKFPSGCLLKGDGGTGFQAAFNTAHGGQNSNDAMVVCQVSGSRDVVAGKSFCRDADAYPNYRWRKSGLCSGTCMLAGMAEAGAAEVGTMAAKMATNTQCLPSDRCCYGACYPAHLLQEDGSCPNKPNRNALVDAVRKSFNNLTRLIK